MTKRRTLTPEEEDRADRLAHEYMYGQAVGTGARCNHRLVQMETAKLRKERERLRAVTDGLGRIADAIFDGHLTPETADEDHPEPYCFECELPWPCDYATLAAALDQATGET